MSAVAPWSEVPAREAWSRRRRHWRAAFDAELEAEEAAFGHARKLRGLLKKRMRELEESGGAVPAQMHESLAALNDQIAWARSRLRGRHAAN